MKRLGLILLGVWIIVILTACGNDSEEASADGNIELTLWNDWTEDRPENTVY